MIFTSLFYYIHSGCVAYGDQNKAVRHHSKNTLRMSHEINFIGMQLADFKVNEIS